MDNSLKTLLPIKQVLADVDSIRIKQAALIAANKERAKDILLSIQFRLSTQVERIEISPPRHYE
jgi:hypothetical protein